MIQQETPPALLGRVGSTVMSFVSTAQVAGLRYPSGICILLLLKALTAPLTARPNLYTQWRVKRIAISFYCDLLQHYTLRLQGCQSDF